MTEWDEREDEEVSDAATQNSTSDTDDSASGSDDALEDTETKIETLSGDGAHEDAADEDLRQVAATVEDDDLADSSMDAASDGQDEVPESPVEVPDEAQVEMPETAKGIDVEEQAEPPELDDRITAQEVAEVAEAGDESGGQDTADLQVPPVEAQQSSPEATVDLGNDLEQNDQRGGQPAEGSTSTGSDVAEPADIDGDDWTLDERTLPPEYYDNASEVAEAGDESGGQDTADLQVPPVEAQQSSPEATVDLGNDLEQNDQRGGQPAEGSTSTGSDVAEPADIDGDDWTLDERTLPPEYYDNASEVIADPPTPDASDGAEGVVANGFEETARGATGRPPTGETAEGPEKTLERLGRGQEVPGGLAFYEPGDATLAAAKDLPALEGHRTYDLHGSTSSVDVAGENVGAKEFADVVRADPNWNGQPVNLFSCDTGKEPEGGGQPFGQHLADELGTPVRAPTELAWSGAGGVPFVTAGKYDPETEDFQPCPPPGEFRTFYPRERTGL